LDPNAGEILTVAPLPVIPLSPFVFHHENLSIFVLTDHFSEHLGSIEIGFAHLNILAVGGQKDLLEGDGITDLGRNPFEADLVPLRNPVLFSPTLKDCVHVADL
jgi:hypothetical protein